MFSFAKFDKQAQILLLSGIFIFIGALNIVVFDFLFGFSCLFFGLSSLLLSQKLYTFFKLTPFQIKNYKIVSTVFFIFSISILVFNLFQL